MDSFIINHTVLSLLQGDVTKQEVDVIVNAANSSLMGGGGVDGAIHRAGGPAIIEECKRIVAAQGSLPAGRAVITTGGDLPAEKVIHTVGPVWSGGDRDEADILANAYRSSLELACSSSLKTIAFPSISTGAYRYPLDQAAQIALKSSVEFIESHVNCFDEVRFVLFDKKTYRAYANALAQITTG